MQPEQDQSPQPTAPNPVASSPVDPVGKPKGPPKWIWFVIIGVVLLVVGVWFSISLLMSNSRGPSQSNNDGQPRQLTELTIGSYPYVYPCSVATEADYARIFALDDTTVGTASETSALPAKDIKAESSDLTKIAPAVSDSYTASCAYTLAKKGATSVSRIDVDVTQFSSEEEASDSFDSAKSVDASDFTSDDVDNGTRQLSKLPSFPNNSYVRLPEANSVLPGLKATFLTESRLITLKYSFEDGENTDNTLPRIDEYAKSIQTKLNAYRGGKPLDLTGRDTFVGKKFINACQHSDLSKAGSILGNIQFRPDEAHFSSTYGSLAGSPAAANGAVSYCQLDFNTPGDREAQLSLKQVEADDNRSPTRRSVPDLTSAAVWPQVLSVTVNTFRGPDEAKALLAAKKQRAANPPTGASTPIIEDITDMGDGAYKYHSENTQSSMYNGQPSDITFIEDTMVIVSGSDVITLQLQQVNDKKDYQTVPIEASEAEFKKVYEMVRSTVAANR